MPAELQRRLAAAGSPEDEAEACSSMCSIVKELAREQMNSWARWVAAAHTEDIFYCMSVSRFRLLLGRQPACSSMCSIVKELACEQMKSWAR